MYCATIKLYNYSALLSRAIMSIAGNSAVRGFINGNGATHLRGRGNREAVQAVKAKADEKARDCCPSTKTSGRGDTPALGTSLRNSMGGRC